MSLHLVAVSTIWGGAIWLNTQALHLGNNLILGHNTSLVRHVPPQLVGTHKVGALHTI